MWRLFYATVWFCVAAWAIGIFVRAIGIDWGFLYLAIASMIAGIDAICGRPTNDGQIIAARRASIYRLTIICSATLLLLWLPIIYWIPIGGGCRPMVQLPFSVFVILPASAIGLAKASRQLMALWPKKRTGLIAISLSLLPFVIYILSQWLILDVLGIVYED
ncbi:MAG TPA: hypothetical protein VGY55_17385 [Pirellulales bacterium]|jgi:hypothetical protein|nr:hypothetical protein [Pirellulales bacterium]